MWKRPLTHQAASATTPSAALDFGPTRWLAAARNVLPATGTCGHGPQQALISTPGPEVPGPRDATKPPPPHLISGAPGGHQAVCESCPSSLSAHLTPLTSFQLLGALPRSPRIKKLAPQSCLVLCSSVLFQSFSLNLSSSSHRVGGEVGGRQETVVAEPPQCK